MTDFKLIDYSKIDLSKIDWSSGIEEIPDDPIPAQPAATNDSTATNGASAPHASWPVLEPEALYGLAGEVVTALKPHTESDPVALLMQYLTYAGNCIGRGPYYQVESTRHYPNLFVVLVGATSKSRKGTSAERIRRIFETVDEEWSSTRIRGGLSSGEGVIYLVRDPIYGTGKKADEIVDKGVADKRLLLDEREYFQGLTVMKRDGNTLSPILRDAWDCREYIGPLTKHSKTEATGAMISIVGHITTDELREKLDHTSIANGWANRFLFACVRRSKLLPFGSSVFDLSEFATRTREALDVAENLEEVTWTPGGAAMWQEIYADLSKDMPGLLGSIAARAEAQTIRLALIYALLDQSPRIRRRHLRAGLAVWKYCEASARFIFGDLLGDPIADVILRALRQSPDGLSRTSIRDLLGRNYGADKIEMALLKLLHLGKARKQMSTPQAAGRPSERWLAV
jgi:hypothetical protein